ncbi:MULTISPECIES: polyphosphate kinase 2 [Oleiagrimonas]|uniref:ADP/GDP-polyphosphate phosphotransferase n=1 Tax=Oleiagrimonas citrea TaxID=1665687 RepID=A0A846ZNY1_9GAMM|nr:MULTISPECIES: polyphosphate kinase 2 [Oleiagrimonas]NKZ39736.1 polyphosphate kinase 2 [Oleiagrimonas citrea]RAP59312.1 polyphosphate kinase 2 [Oleiagrimonas sp. MCCC 1A03011]
MKRKDYEDALEGLQAELIGVSRWLRASGRRLMVIFEGRDAAGKGGTIRAITEHLDTRSYRVVALPKPSDRESTQWYFQRYVAHLPAAGEFVLFDRSWYNRAGVEPLMGFCTQAQYAQFLDECPIFERMLADDGILLLKYWLAVDQANQEERFAERAQDPLKRWKLSPIDVAAREKYAEIGRLRDVMLERTHAPHAPWFVVDYNDQRRGRLNLLRHLLDRLPDTTVPTAALDLPALREQPGREQLADPSFWIEPRH